MPCQIESQLVQIISEVLRTLNAGIDGTSGVIDFVRRHTLLPCDPSAKNVETFITSASICHLAININ